MAQIVLASDGRTATVRPLPPYDLSATVRLLQRRPTNVVDLWEDDAYWRLLPIEGEDRLVSVRQMGTMENPLLAVRLESGAPAPAAVREVAETAALMLGVDVDVAPFFTLAERLPAFAPLAVRLRGLRPPRFPTLYETFVNVITFQQISLLAALAITGRLAQRYGRGVEHQGRLYRALPGPEVMADADVDDMRRLGFSLRKAEVLRALAQRIVDADPVLEGLETLPSQAAIERLITLPGIGRWSAEVILLRGFGRLDVFPTGDAGVDRGLAGILGRDSVPGKAEQAALLERFGPWRGMLYFLIAASRLVDLH